MRDWQKTMQQPCRKFRELLRVRRVAGKGVSDFTFPIEFRAYISASLPAPYQPFGASSGSHSRPGKVR